MKKQLFTILSALSLGTLSAQTPSPDWSIAQDANFPFTIAGHQYMDAINSNVAWVSGFDGAAGNGLNYSYVSVTSNGGASWSTNPVFPDTNSWRISNLEGFDANTAWVAAWNNATGGGGSLWRTINGGASWSNVTAAGMYTNSAAFANWVTWLNPSTAIANGDPVGGEFELWRTTDGATSWSLVPGANIPNPQSGEYAVVDLYTTFGPSNMWFGTNRGRVYRTTDAGATWSVSSVISANTATILEIDFASTTHGLAYMVNTVSGGVIYELYNTTDGGVTWGKILGQGIAVVGGTLDIPANFGLNEMQPVPGTNWFVSAGNSTLTLLGLSYSKDNGVTWTDWGSSQIGYNTIDMADRFTGWAGGYAYSSPAADVLHKYDGTAFNAMFTIPQSVCMGANDVTVSPVNTSSSAAGSYSFNWSSSPAAVFSSNTASVPVITFNNVGTYTVVLSVTDANGTGTLSQVINVASCSAPVASFTMASTGCNSSILTLTNTSTGGPAPSVTVTANPSTNVQIVNVGNNQYSLIFQDPGTYTVNMFGSSISGTTSATQVVTINDCKPYYTFDMHNVVCRKRSTGGADTVYITPSIATSTLYSAQQFTWTLLNVNPGISLFPSTNTLVPPSKKIILSTDPQTYGMTSYTVILRVANQYGASEYSEILTVTVDNCVGIDEHGGWTSLVNVYPNPAHDKITVSVPSSARAYNVKIVNILGAVVFEERANTSGEININLNDIKKGVYFVEIENAGTTVTRKFIVD